MEASTRRDFAYTLEVVAVAAGVRQFSLLAPDSEFLASKRSL